MWGDKNKIRLFKDIYAPAFKINYCPMCGKKTAITWYNFRTKLRYNIGNREEWGNEGNIIQSKAQGME